MAYCYNHFDSDRVNGRTIIEQYTIFSCGSNLSNTFSSTHIPLQSLNGNTPDHLVVTEILSHVSHLHKAGKQVIFCWTPGHTGLPSNKATDANAFHGNITSDQVLGSDVSTALIHTFLSL
jgi:hypothetical protein